MQPRKLLTRWLAADYSCPAVRGRSSALLLLGLCAALEVPPTSRAGVIWKGASNGCEPLSTFYSSSHQTGSPPCCSTQPDVCPGGTACPVGGRCPGTQTPCVAGAPPNRPNVILTISDDQGSCHYGTAGECRSVQTGTPIPPPSTPNLDLLAGYGTIFPIAHNTASWCFPSLNSILTGRYQKSFNGMRRDLSGNFRTIPAVLRDLEGAPGAVQDPFDPDNAVGGYCTLLAGKFTGAAGKTEFNGEARTGDRALGRTLCNAGPPGQPPLCGSQTQATYDPLTTFHIHDLFEFMDSVFYPVPGTPGAFTHAPFFIWYAPRIPHAPLRAPGVIESYLFGAGLGGLLDLGAMCRGASCPPAVQSFSESNFGSERDYYANVWWVDDTVREIREYLSRKSAPHCIGGNGQSRFPVNNPSQCPGTWATSLAPALDRNTIIIYLSDNGWFLPNSKHAFTENGYRTRLIVYDPQVDALPSWMPSAPAPPPFESPALAHSTDLLPTILGLALGTRGLQSCPVSEDGTPCDGRDLRPYLRVFASLGDPLSETPLRHSLCGHHTQRGTAPTRQRYLLTRPGSVGRCVDRSLPACTSTANCAAGQACIGGHCAATAATACATASQCPKGSACLGGLCRVGPPCVDDQTCAALFPGQQTACLEQRTKWCRNAPNVSCESADDCPACPAGPGPEAPPCSRLCEHRQLKLYLGTNSTNAEMVDLFLDPDERGRQGTGDVGLFTGMSSQSGPYGADLGRLSCCVDAWWPQGARGGTRCTPAYVCPADFTCNQ